MSTLSCVARRSIALTASSEFERSSYSTTSTWSFLPPTEMPPAAFTSFTRADSWERGDAGATREGAVFRDCVADPDLVLACARLA